MAVFTAPNCKLIQRFIGTDKVMPLSETRNIPINIGKKKNEQKTNFEYQTQAKVHKFVDSRSLRTHP